MRFLSFITAAFIISRAKLMTYLYLLVILLFVENININLVHSNFKDICLIILKEIM